MLARTPSHLMTGYLPSWADDDELTAVARTEFRKRMERWPYEPQRERPPPETEDESDFARHFHELVGPRLRNLIIAQARCVAASVATFGSACLAVQQYALKYGAEYLSEHARQDLVDWISDHMLHAILEAEDDGWSHWPDLRPGTAAWEWSKSQERQP